MRVLLTGGAGYIGLHTAVVLCQAGHDVILADNFSNSRPEMVSRAEKIVGCPLPLYEIDVADAAALDRVFSENAIDAVIHFAGLKAVGESTEKPLQYYRNNLDTALTVLETMAAHGVKTLVFSSSATVYSLTDRVPFTEDAATGCTNPYGWTKYMIEQIIRDACAADPALRAVLLRYFNPIGAHESGLIGEETGGLPNNLMPYITQVASGRLPVLHVFGSDYPTPDGTGVRDYLHVMDLAEGHLAALNYAAKNPGAETVNLGSGRGVSVLELVETFQRVNGVQVPYTLTDRRPGDVAVCCADPSKARTLLGWEAVRTLEDMCRDAWNWQRHADL